jgi:hypothetical protein
MLFSQPTPAPCQWSSRLGAALDRRTAVRLALVFVGAVLARGRRTVTSWIRAAGLSAGYKPVSTAVAAAGKRADAIAARQAWEVMKLLAATSGRLTFALDDTPTPRYGLQVQGAGVHHNPAPGPAGSPFVYGHVRGVLGLLVGHPLWGVIALPLLARLYVRPKNLGRIDPRHRPPFRTKLELAVELTRWAVTWLGFLGKRVWVVAGGAYAKAPFLEPMRGLGVTVVSRLREGAALWGVPRHRPGRRGRPRVYGENRVELAKRAGQRRVRFVWASVGAFHICLWTFTMTDPGDAHNFGIRGQCPGCQVQTGQTGRPFRHGEDRPRRRWAILADPCTALGPVG